MTGAIHIDRMDLKWNKKGDYFARLELIFENDEGVKWQRINGALLYPASHGYDKPLIKPPRAYGVIQWDQDWSRDLAQQLVNHGPVAAMFDEAKKMQYDWDRDKGEAK